MFFCKSIEVGWVGLVQANSVSSFLSLVLTQHFKITAQLLVWYWLGLFGLKNSLISTQLYLRALGKGDAYKGLLVTREHVTGSAGATRFWAVMGSIYHFSSGEKMEDDPLEVYFFKIPFFLLLLYLYRFLLTS